MSEKKFGRIRTAVAIGVGLALIPAAMFAATTTRPIDGLTGVIRDQATPTATAKAATPAATTAPAKAATAAATVAAAPKAGSGGFLGQESNGNTMTIILLVAAAASVAVAGRMVTRRR